MAALDFFFGSDPGAGSRRALEQFGLTGGGVGKEFMSGLTNAALLSGARSRQASGQQLARSGLQGSGIAFDVQENADLLEADFLRKARMDLIRQRLQALGLVASQPAQKGFIQSGVESFASGFGSGLGGKVG